MTAPLPVPAPSLALDPIVAGLAGDLLGAVWDAYGHPLAAAAGLAPPCVAGLVSGSAIVADYCCEGTDAAGNACQGQLTVRVSNVFPTAVFPNPRQDAIPVGGVDGDGSSWAVELEVAVLRCAPVMDEDGLPPSIADQQSSALTVMGDAALIRQAVTGFAISRDQAHIFGQYSPLGPEGGCVGSGVLCTFLVE